MSMVELLDSPACSWSVLLTGAAALLGGAAFAASTAFHMRGAPARPPEPSGAPAS